MAEKYGIIVSVEGIPSILRLTLCEDSFVRNAMHVPVSGKSQI